MPYATEGGGPSGPLEKLSGALANLIVKVGKSPAARHAIDEIVAGLDKFGTTLASSKFRRELDTWLGNIDRLEKRLFGFFDRIAGYYAKYKAVDDAFQTMPEDARDYWADKWRGLKNWFGSQALNNYMGQMDQRYGLPANTIELIKQLENSSADAVSPAGAMGLMQLMPQSIKELGVQNPFDPDQSVEGGGKRLAHLFAKYGNSVQGFQEMLASYNAGEGRVDAALAQAARTHGNWLGLLPQETQQYVARGMIHVVVTGVPGGSAVVTVNGLATGAQR